MDLLMNEQKFNEPNPLYSLANITRQHVTQADTHPDLVPPDQHTNNTKSDESIIKYIQYVHDIIATDIHTLTFIFIADCICSHT